MYCATEVTFNTQVILACGLVTSALQLTVGELALPSVLYACSMKGARVIAEVGADFPETLELHDNRALLHLGFRPKDELSDFTFLVASRVESLAVFSTRKPQVQFLTLFFRQKPPDMLIAILGSLLETNANAVGRRQQRIVLTPESMKKIGMASKESCVAFGGASRRCIVQDLSLGGAKVLVTAAGNGNGDTRIALKLARCEVKDDILLNGSIVRVEDVDGRSDMVALSIRYSSEPPASYKEKITSYLAAKNAG